ncbi:hypothetical protein ROJ8625_01705 [Roseivivax jejudonensis]|uniref:Uncharacterized protein n=1 Tax=Roseivivax jejudonensis TaxID=1529041 RepID=A0A1X6Z1P8_9RHOB|nr:hypothetical protein [Roseivivax jejudonensis]SLN37368.1 hypothetical protein ROJ8625_01705 [Roseivivax jejudonensis]
MFTDVFVIGLGALFLVAVLIVAVTGRATRKSDMHANQGREPSYLARDGRS